MIERLDRFFEGGIDWPMTVLYQWEVMATMVIVMWWRWSWSMIAVIKWRVTIDDMLEQQIDWPFSKTMSRPLQRRNHLTQKLPKLAIRSERKNSAVYWLWEWKRPFEDGMRYHYSNTYALLQTCAWFDWFLFSKEACSLLSFSDSSSTLVNCERRAGTLQGVIFKGIRPHLRKASLLLQTIFYNFSLKQNGYVSFSFQINFYNFS